MADMSMAYQIIGVDGLSGPAGTAAAALGRLEAAGSRVGSVLGTAVHAGAIAAAAGLAAIGAGIAASISSATSFEQAISHIGAVAGASASQMQQLSSTALELGKATSFSASEAAAGMEELIKAGVSITDVIGGGAKAALDLAAAGGVSVAEAATIASNAMNVFSVDGANAGHVADVIAGAANASAIDVHDFGFSLSAVGAVAATVGLSLEDTATSIAVLGQAGLRGSDAGTSLKTMLLNLSPTSKAATAEMRALGIITADGSNRFFDATGKVKGMAEVAQVLQDSMKGLTKEQQINALQTAFGTDAIRAAAIMAKAGAAGFNEMAEAESKVTAQAVGMERLNNLAGDIEQLKGSLETAAITIGTAFLPALRTLTQTATAGVNQAITIFQKLPAAWEEIKAIFRGDTVSAGNVVDILAVFGLSTFTADLRNIVRQAGDIWRTIPQAFKGDWSPSDTVDPIVNAIGTIATAAGKVPAEIDKVITKIGELAGINLDGATGPWEKLGTVVSEAANRITESVTKIKTESDQAVQAAAESTGKSTAEMNDFWLSANGIQETSSGGLLAGLQRFAQGFADTWARMKADSAQYQDMWMGGNGIVVGTDQGAAGVLATLDGWVRDFAAAVARINTEGRAPYEQMWLEMNGITTTQSGGILGIIGEWARQIGVTISGANTTNVETIKTFWADANGASTEGTSVVGTTIATWWETQKAGWTTWSSENLATSTAFWSDANGASAEGTSVIGTTISGWWETQKTGWSQWGADTAASVKAGLDAAIANVTATTGEWLAAGQALGQSIVTGVTSTLSGLVEAVMGPIRAAIEAAKGAMSGLNFGGGGGGSNAGGGSAAMLSNRSGGTHAAPYLSLINQVSAETGVPADVIAGIMDTEGSPAGSTSPAGARGLMQVMPNYVHPGENPFDPLTSIRQGARALQEKYRATGTWEGAAGAYFGYGVDAGGMSTSVYQQRFNQNRAQYQNMPAAPADQMNRIPLGPNPLAAGTTGIGGWTPNDMQAVIDLAPPWERAMAQVQTSGETAFTGVLKSSTDMGDGVMLTTTQTGATVTATMTDAAGTILGQWNSLATDVPAAATTMGTDVVTATGGMASQALISVTDLGTGILTSITDTAGTTTATVTDMAGNVTSQFTSMADGTQLAANTMGQGTVTSVNTMGTGIITSVADMAGNTVTTITDMAGNVVTQYTTMAGGATTQTDVMRTGVTTSAQAMGTDVATTTATMATGVLTSVTDMGNGVTMTVNTTAQGTVATLTDWSGQVIGVYTETESQTSEAVDMMASNTEDAFGQVADASSTVKDALGEAATGFKDAGTAAKTAAPPVKDFGTALGDIEPPDLGDFIGDLKSIQRAAEAAKKAVGNLLSSEGIGNAIKGGAGRAAGGPVTAGETYLVGEAGVPELFVPDRSGYIMPLSDLRLTSGRPGYIMPNAGLGVPSRMDASGSGAPVQTIVFRVADPDGRTLEEWFIRGRELAAQRMRD